MSLQSAPSISRENIVLHLDTLFAGDIRIVTVEGQEGIGKTTLLKEIVGQRRTNSVALFITSASRWAYDPDELATDMSRQMAKLLGAQESADSDGPGEYRKRLHALIRKVSAGDKLFYFVIDGLGELPEDDSATLQQIIGLLPFGIENFRFLIAAEVSRLGLNRSATRFHKPLLLSPFTRDEASRYMQDLNLPPSALNEIYSLSRGVPGHLASIRRILVGSLNPVQEVAQLPQTLPQLFEREWTEIPKSDDARILMAMLAHENRRYSSDELSAVTKISADRVDAILGSIGFIEENERGFRYVSEAYRRFVRDELNSLTSRVNDLFIEYHLSQPEADPSLANLTGLLIGAGRFKELVEYLSPERFAHLYLKAPSLRAVQATADEGIEAAARLAKDGDLVRFTLQRSTISELASSQVLVSEIRARTAIGDYETAFALAESASRVEVKLRLLAALGRARREQSLPNDPILLERIGSVLETVGDTLPAEEVEPIAADLFYVAPEKAIAIIARRSPNLDDENAIDWGLARLAVQAQMAELETGESGTAKTIAKEIRLPAAKQLSLAAFVILGRVSAAEAIKSTEDLETTGSRLQVLRYWMRANQDRPDAQAILDFGFRMATQATGYTANAEVMRELALCLPYLKDTQAVSYYIGLLDSQRAVLERLGPPDDFVRLQLLLARAQWRMDQSLGRERFEEVYNTVGQISELEVRTAASAMLLTAVSRLTREQGGSELADLLMLADAEFERAFVSVLSSSADQVEAISPTIEALAQGECGLAIKKIDQLNTLWRRDDALRRLVVAAVQRPLLEIEVTSVIQALDQIVDVEIRDGAIETVVGTLTRVKHSAASLAHVAPLLQKILAVEDTEMRAPLLADLIRVAASRTEPFAATLVDSARTALAVAWENSDDNWVKLDAGLAIVDALAKVSRDDAFQYIAEVNRLKKYLSLQEPEAAPLCQDSVRQFHPLELLSL